jgi:hypothetical protein
MSYDDNENSQTIVNRGDGNTSYQGNQKVSGNHSVSLQGSGNVVTIQSGNGRLFDVDYTRCERSAASPPILIGGSLVSFLVGALAVWADYITVTDSINKKGGQWTANALLSWTYTIPGTPIKIPAVATPLPLFGRISLALFWHLVILQPKRSVWRGGVLSSFGGTTYWSKSMALYAG